MAIQRPWLLFPFSAGSKRDVNHERRTAARHTGDSSEHRGNEVEYELAHQETHQEIAVKTEEEIIADYNSPIHMWIVTTLFPLIAGTFGPMASMFNVCAIAVYWRVVVNPESVRLPLLTKESGGHYIKDPSWLLGVNVVSLVIAVIANISLLGQMTNRLRYNISAPITIIGFYLSGLVDIALVAAASQWLALPPTPNATYSQAFYYAAFSGAIYFIMAMMLTVTAWGVWVGHYSNEFKLSLSQRSLMLQTILFLVYILCAGAVYAKIENWSYLDANYFIVVTLFTIGFGDLVPTTHLGRSLYFPFTVGGILFVGVIIANIRTLVLESGSVKVSTRLVEKSRYKAIKKGNPAEGILKIHGVRRRSTNGATELERRKKEFQIMREIQAYAAHTNRLIALSVAIVAFMILWFIGAVAFWKAESESVGGQNWSYFESLYFTFVAQLTVGYGDFEPQTNSAKPTFVFWALIALPTLTVLIGSVGDAVSSFVNWYTIWVGNHTQTLYAIIEAIWQKENKVMDKLRKVERNDETANDPDRHFYDIAKIEQCLTVPLHVNVDSLSEWQAAIAEETYRPFIVLKAAQKILMHLDADPPRKYTFEEWAWLLKLLGEDETDEEGHRRVGVPLPQGARVVTPVRSEKNHMWSWLGQESPLMSLEDGSEAKWVLTRLMRMLEDELRNTADRRIARDIGPEIGPIADESEKEKSSDTVPS